MAVPTRQCLPVRLAETAIHLTRGRTIAGLARFYVITHLHYFGEQSLRLVLGKTGWRVLLLTREISCLQQLDLDYLSRTVLGAVFNLMRLHGSGNRILVYAEKIQT